MSESNAKEKAEPVAKKSKRGGSLILGFLEEKMGAQQAEAEHQAKMQKELVTMMKNYNAANITDFEQNGSQVTELFLLIRLHPNSHGQYIN